MSTPRDDSAVWRIPLDFRVSTFALRSLLEDAYQADMWSNFLCPAIQRPLDDGMIPGHRRSGQRRRSLRPMAWTQAPRALSPSNGSSRACCGVASPPSQSPFDPTGRSDENLSNGYRTDRSLIGHVVTGEIEKRQTKSDGGRGAGKPPHKSETRRSDREAATEIVRSGALRKSRCKSDGGGGALEVMSVIEERTRTSAVEKSGAQKTQITDGAIGRSFGAESAMRSGRVAAIREDK